MGKESNAILGVIAGTAIGAVLGILLAPDKGSNTRQRIVDEASGMKDKVVNDLNRMSNQVAEKVSTQRETIDEALENLTTNASYKADEIITSLEKKLAELKAKNKKFQKS